MAHTAVSDSYREMDPEQAAEMRMGAGGTDEYAREVRGHFDEPMDPSDMDDRDYDGPEPDCCEECGGAVNRHYECSNPNCPTNDGRDDDGDNMTDVEADADALASAGYGTDEDYGGGNEDFGWDGGMEE